MEPSASFSKNSRSSGRHLWLLTLLIRETYFMFVTLKEYVSMLSWVYVCVGDGAKLENCFCSTPLVLCCSFSLKREREIERKRTGWVVWTWVQVPDLSEPLLMGWCLNKIEYRWFSYKLQLQEREVILSSFLYWSRAHVHPGRVVPWPGCACLPCPAAAGAVAEPVQKARCTCW